jgi:SAM-dependent methyltransferase
MTSDRPVAAARIISLYEETAAAWDEIRGRNPSEYEPEYFDRFLAGVRPGGAILDLGCGTGHPVANYLLERGFRVTGVDSAPSLIALARDRLPAGEWLVGDMRTLDLGRRFDGILAWYSFFHLAPDDQRAMFPVFAAHALPGAPLSFPSGPLAGEAIGEWQGEPLYHASLAPAEYCTLLQENGFDLLSFHAGMPLASGPSVWLARASLWEGRPKPDTKGL